MRAPRCQRRPIRPPRPRPPTPRKALRRRRASDLAAPPPTNRHGTGPSKPLPSHPPPPPRAPSRARCGHHRPSRKRGGPSKALGAKGPAPTQLPHALRSNNRSGARAAAQTPPQKSTALCRSTRAPAPATPDARRARHAASRRQRASTRFRSCLGAPPDGRLHWPQFEGRLCRNRAASVDLASWTRPAGQPTTSSWWSARANLSTRAWAQVRELRGRVS
mmetsp:Transcript_158596/g.508807  ORF Transcript_158596/g.508807 Transcript_158596/m.508807 type:complete len:219 (-) Transcript_158596:8-664(-)